jgi:serine phosphatase RsbU (regulator of sigma subunit)
MSNHEDELFVFADEETSSNSDSSAQTKSDNTLPTDISIERTFHVPTTSEKWKILIADDEEEVHTVTRFALMDYKYKGKKLEFLNAYTGKQAVEILRENPDIALILLDVVMEHNHAGLEAVELIRDEIKNHFVRIILRTGQPGQAPEDEVIIKYDINDYKNKTELTDKKLFTTLTTGLRSYADIIEIEALRQNLEDKVIERTFEVVEKSKIIEKKNEDITASINYAFRIQDSMLPDEDKIQRILPELFILFKPRDIVSGDFYWFGEKDGKIIISAIDCTGHGVPGAFMSMIGDSHLNHIINMDGITSPDTILNKLHLRVRNSLKQAETLNRDGMDMAICTIDPYRKIMDCAGAKNPIIYIQDGVLTQIKGDKMPIGGEQREDQRIFTKHTVKLDRPTTVYMYTDGYQDQFGGPDNRKFMVTKLRELLFQIHEKPFTEQRQVLDETFENWKHIPKEREQTDDTLVIGFKINL